MSDHEIVPESTIDLDAIIAKRVEEVGSEDKFPIKFRERIWWLQDPVLADDEWRDGLREITELEEDSPDTALIAEHYLGSEQWEKFVEAGGHSGIVMQAVRIYSEQQRDVDGDGNPTRPPRFSARTQKRRKRR